MPQIEIRLHKVNPSVSWPTLEASDTRPAANWSLPTEPPRVSTVPRVQCVRCYQPLQLLVSLQTLHAVHTCYLISSTARARSHADYLLHRMQTYPSSRKQVVDWNKLEHDLKEEEKTEVLDGEAGAQKLFRTIYAGTFCHAVFRCDCAGSVVIAQSMLTLVLCGVSEPGGSWCR